MESLKYKNATLINNKHPKKPANVEIINHVYSHPIVSDNVFLIDQNIICLPNVCSLNGVFIQNPKIQQQIYLDELFDCIALGIIGKQQKETYLFGAHIYISILEDQLANIFNQFKKKEIIPEKIFYSPRFDSEDKELGKDYLEKQLNKPIQQITRHNNTESLCKLSLEKIILNDKIRSWE